MYIEHYAFGKLTVGGETYHSDVIIFPDRVSPSWRRRWGHSLVPEDLTDVIKYRPDALIVGCGNTGALRVPVETLDYLEARGIRIHVARTRDAIDLYNSLPKCQRIVLALHLTC